ncbi:MAG: ABC transporter permease [Tissierellia bacterium]|nr:ABC transporter permease [Tissierellia bacterium]
MKKYSIPYFLWMILFIILPIFLILLYSFSGTKIIDFQNFQCSLNNYKRVFEPIYLKIIGRSLWMAFVSTIVTLGVGYPVAYIISREKEKKRNLLILFFIIPMWMNFLLRTYAWLTLLGNNGIINRFLGIFHIGPWDLMYNDRAILLGMIYNFLPFMVLPIYSVLIKIDKSYVEAAKDLGASKFIVFWKVIFPLSLPGVITGITMVFIPGISTFIISSLLGGNKYYLIGNLIEQQFRFTGNWAFGSALSVILIVILMILLGLSRFISKNKGKGVLL